MYIYIFILENISQRTVVSNKNMASNVPPSIGEFSKTNYPHSRELFTVILYR